MKKAYLLESDDIFMESDMVRNAIPDSHRCQYSSRCDTDWKRVGDVMPFWVGKKVSSFLKGVNRFHYQPNKYEFIGK